MLDISAQDIKVWLQLTQKNESMYDITGESETASTQSN